MGWTAISPTNSAVATTLVMKPLLWWGFGTWSWSPKARAQASLWTGSWTNSPANRHLLIWLFSRAFTCLSGDKVNGVY